MKIAVFMGGTSDERAVSLNSGQAVYAALKEFWPDTTLFDVEWNGKWTLFDAVQRCVDDKTDVVFNILHGGLGENGGVQGILEAAGLTYTGSGIIASAAAMDKDITKTIFAAHTIPTADWITGTASSLDTDTVIDQVGIPCVVKPVDQGSSVGVAVVKDATKLSESLADISKFGTRIMAERFIPGRELSVPVFNGEAMPVIEIRPHHEIYDYECKYTAGMSDYFVPAPIPEKLAQSVQEYAISAFNALGLRDIARIDFRLDENDTPLCFEANTQPGMTATSLVPKSAAEVGIDFPELVRRIVIAAYERKGSR